MIPRMPIRATTARGIRRLLEENEWLDPLRLARTGDRTGGGGR